jgi:hypothetical protein
MDGLAGLILSNMGLTCQMGTVAQHDNYFI